MAFGFSGYLLPWDELAFFATKVGTDIVGVIPVFGETLRTILRGGEDVTGATLSRFFGIHVAILPAITTVLLVLHLLFIQRQGMHEPEKFTKLPEDEKKYIPFFPHFALKDALFWLIVFNALLFLSVYFPWELGAKADPLTSAPIGIRPEWYFIFMFETLKLIPPHMLFLEGELVGVFGFIIAGFIWMIWPFLPIKDKKRNKIGIGFNTFIGLLVVAFILVMTVIGYL